jgi:hypothetical protein
LVDRIAEEHHLLGPPLADAAGHPNRAAAAREHRQLDLRQAEPHVVAGHQQVAAHRHLQAAAIGQAVEGGDGRLREVVELAVGGVFLGELAAHHLARPRQLRELADVRAGAEGPVAGAGKSHQVQRRVVEGQHRDAVATLRSNEIGRHCFCSVVVRAQGGFGDCAVEASMGSWPIIGIRSRRRGLPEGGGA